MFEINGLIQVCLFSSFRFYSLLINTYMQPQKQNIQFISWIRCTVNFKVDFFFNNDFKVDFKIKILLKKKEILTKTLVIKE